MNVLRRILLFLWGLILLAGAILVFVAMANRAVWHSIFTQLQQILFNDGTSFWVLILIALALAVLGIFHIVVALFRHKSSLLATVSANEEGQVNISLNAIDNVVTRAAFQVENIKEVKTQIKPVDNGIAIYLKVVVPPNTKIPETAATLQKVVKEQIELMTGLKVAEVKVLVSNVGQGSDGNK